MNAPAAIVPAVRAVDPAEPREAAAAEAYAAAHAASSPFHRPAWSAAVASAIGQRAHFLMAERGGRIAGLLPLTHIRSRLFGSALVSAGFAVDGGILADDPAAARALADAAAALAGRLGCGAELRGGILPDGWARSEGVYAGFERPLAPDEAAILAAIPRKQRAEVRRALGSGLAIDIHRDAARHHAVYAESVRNLGTPVFPRRLFDAVLAAFGPDADILTVSGPDGPLASVLSLYHRGTVYPFWGGGTRAARAARANELMYFALMRSAAARGCTRFDFGRSKLGTGAFAFKKNWGFAPRPLVYATLGPRRETNPLAPRYRLQVALWKRLPLPLANALGPLIARSLG
jgi:FemAB-related protein (PEP-CTERM system-associated)